MRPQIQPRTLVFSLGALLLAIAFFPHIANTQENPKDPKEKEKEEKNKLIIKAEADKRIEGIYIVGLKDPGLSTREIRATANRLVRGKGKILFFYENAIPGFAVSFREQKNAEENAAEQNAMEINEDPDVDFVEEDSKVSLVQTQTNPPSWGLDRVDQRSLPLNTSYNYNNNGTGVNAYVIDSGILTTHSDFGGRAVAAYDAVNDGNGSTDCNGHGTHVAGTIGSNTYGVAKNVNLYSVRVMDCGGGGSVSKVLAGVDWVTANHVKPAVVNMSLGGRSNTTIDNAVRNSIAAGVTYVVAAGNDGRDASLYSPARVTQALTVGASDRTDRKANFSNYGSPVDVFAPGSDIISTWSDGSTKTISGTSMASPHVAGVAALYLQSNPTALPSNVSNAIIQSATPNKVTNPGRNSPNRLLYSGPSN